MRPTVPRLDHAPATTWDANQNQVGLERRRRRIIVNTSGLRDTSRPGTQRYLADIRPNGLASWICTALRRPVQLSAVGLPSKLVPQR